MTDTFPTQDTPPSSSKRRGRHCAAFSCANSYYDAKGNATGLHFFSFPKMVQSSLYTNIPQEEGTEIVCKAYDSFHNYNPPTPTRFLREMLGLILNENSFQFNGENYLQTHRTAMGTKMAVSFANIFMAFQKPEKYQGFNGIRTRDIRDFS